MVSRTPETEAKSVEYMQGWESLKRMIVEENASWSGSERNHVFLNLQDGSFADVSTMSAADMIGDGRSMAETDWDDDGRPDFLLRNRTAPRLQLFRNQDAGDNHFVAIELRGTECNRDAIGAIVRVQTGEQVRSRTMYAGDGFLSQSSKRLTIGMGAAERIDRLSIQWPGGDETVLEDLAADTRYRITQGSDEAEVIPARTLERFAALPAAPLEKDTTGIPRLDLREKLSLAPIPFPAFEDPERTGESFRGSPTLVNLWGTTCAACLKEFGEFRDRRSELDATGLKIVAMATDGLTERERADELLSKYKLTKHAGYLDDRLLSLLQVIFSLVVGSQEQTPLPTSLLLDEEAQLVAIYFGPVATDDLLADLKRLKRMDTSDPQDTRLAYGRWLTKNKRPYRALIQELRGMGEDELREYYSKLSKGR